MRGEEIWSLIAKDAFLQHHFSGIHASDTLTGIERREKFIIVNTAPLGTDGSHWIVIYRSGDELEVFDPLGFKLEEQGSILESFALLGGISRVVISERSYQSDSSDSCGAFCIYFAYQRIILHMDENLATVLEHIFSSNPLENETRVMQCIEMIRRSE